MLVKSFLCLAWQAALRDSLRLSPTPQFRIQWSNPNTRIHSPVSSQPVMHTPFSAPHNLSPWSWASSSEKRPYTELSRRPSDRLFPESSHPGSLHVAWSAGCQSPAYLCPLGCQVMPLLVEEVVYREVKTVGWADMQCIVQVWRQLYTCLVLAKLPTTQ